jgi:mono/diheme cytochrome c family protein
MEAEDMSTVVRRAVLPGIALFCLAWMAWAAPSRPNQREEYTSGAHLYRAYCASCHGDTGRGDGPVADLGPRPPDLTQLTRKAGGTFPRAEVLAVLRQTRRLPGHQAPAMPNWLELLRRSEHRDERVVEQRLDALVAHIESLQITTRER